MTHPGTITTKAIIPGMITKLKAEFPTGRFLKSMKKYTEDGKRFRVIDMIDREKYPDLCSQILARYFTNSDKRYGKYGGLVTN